MIELLTAQGQINKLILTIEKKYSGKNIPEATESVLSTLKTALNATLIAEKNFKELTS